ncbi:DsbC family protein [Aliidiomarina maris]|uniref:Thiol:disulfide interchange protein n=1 Tax=Aliidiomarina maris TaxID=531312 RepID=A0A327WX58_9GAMM|nr:DsbC family protein [Aliidiomarina maris]MCL5048930.1 DsbC family protein [Bacillota bacterium]RAJ96510.1 thioredoxin-like protein [Aliidiomarina maris]
MVKRLTLCTLFACMLAMCLFALRVANDVSPSLDASDSPACTSARCVESELAQLNMNAYSITEGFAPNWWLLETAQGEWHYHAVQRVLLAGPWLDVANPEQVVDKSAQRQRQQRQTFLANARAQGVLMPQDIASSAAAPIEIAVFTDPTCGYCRRLHQDLPQLAELGVQVRYYAFARAGEGSPGEQQLAAIWCASNPSQAMNDAKQSQDIDTATVTAACTTKVQQQRAMALRLGVQGTPSMILPDGRLLLGYRNPAQVMQALEPVLQRDRTK